MIELWTEDSTAGYKFLKIINKILYNNQLKVIPHSGVGDATPSTGKPYGGLLYHLKNLTSNNLVLLYVDKCIDHQDTKENYGNIIKEVRNHKNVFIIDQICFEFGMLSYTHLFDICGNTDEKLKKVANEFVTLSSDLINFRPTNFTKNLAEYANAQCGVKMHYEVLAKGLLSNITNIDTFYKSKEGKSGHHSYTLISDDFIGKCWQVNCCVIPNQYQNARKCKLNNTYMTLSQKIHDVVNNSNVLNQVNQINGFVCNYINTNYRVTSPNEELYKQTYCKKYGEAKIIAHIGKLMEIYDYWNYERLYNTF